MKLQCLLFVFFIIFVIKCTLLINIHIVYPTAMGKIKIFKSYA